MYDASMQKIIKILIVAVAFSGAGFVNAAPSERHRERVVKRVQQSIKIRKSKPKKVAFRFQATQLSPRGQAKAAVDALRSR